MKWDISDIRNWSWDKHPLGLAGIEPGNSVQIQTGSWRSLRPVVDSEKCNDCGVCFIYCPDGAITFKDGKRQDTDYEHCKGCGICAHECGRKAITMVDEYSSQV